MSSIFYRISRFFKALLFDIQTPFNRFTLKITNLNKQQFQKMFCCINNEKNTAHKKYIILFIMNALQLL